MVFFAIKSIGIVAFHVAVGAGRWFRQQVCGHRESDTVGIVGGFGEPIFIKRCIDCEFERPARTREGRRA